MSADLNELDTRPVVVGVDGSQAGTAALHWAVAEARLRASTLRAVHAWLWPFFHVDLGPGPGAPPDAGLRGQARRVLADALDQVHTLAPELDVTPLLVTGDPAVVLNQEANNAELLVIGCRGLGGFSGLLLGSVGVALAGRTACPLVVVRGGSPSAGPVVVGVDGSQRSQRAASRAFDEAARRGLPLTVVTAMDLPRAPVTWARARWATFVDSSEREARAMVDAVVAEPRRRWPSVPVNVRVEAGSPADILVRASRNATLLVVGARGLGGIRGPALGSVTHALIHHSGCPVLVDHLSAAHQELAPLEPAAQDV